MEPDIAAEWGLPPLPHGLLLCLLQPGGAHVTVATTDIPYWEMVVDALSPERHPEQSPPLVLPSARFPKIRTGWPDEWQPTADSADWADAEKPPQPGDTVTADSAHTVLTGRPSGMSI